MISYQCVGCKRNNGDGTCEAFPEGIPQEIAMGKVSHLEPVKGDKGLTWVPLNKKSYDLVMASHVGGQPEKYAKQTNLFEEYKHPRDKSGKFVSKGSEGKGGAKPKQKTEDGRKGSQPPSIFHGTHHDFDRMDREAGYKHTTNKQEGSIDTLGGWFTDSAETASSLYGPKVLQARGGIKKPFIIHESKQGAAFRKLEELKNRKGGTDGLRNWLLDNGYDSVQLIDAHVDRKNQTVTIVLEPEKLKLDQVESGSATEAARSVEEEEPNLRFLLPKAKPIKRTPEGQPKGKPPKAKAISSPGQEKKEKPKYPPIPDDEPSEAVQRVASYFGLPHVSAADEKKASNFTVLMAKKLSGDQFSDPESAAEFLESSKDHLQNVIGLATQYGFKTGAKRFGTRAASAQDFLIRQAEKTGYEASGKDYKSAFSGAIDHLREEYAKNPTEEPPIQKDSNGTPWAEVAKFAIGFLLGKRIFDGILGN